MKQLIFIVLLFIFLFPQTVQAKVLPQAKSTIKTNTATKNVKASGITISPKLRADRRALVVYFSNLQNASNVSYMLTYQTYAQDEGAMGALNLTGAANQNTELLFGTCSKNVCRYHTGIKNAKLEISYTTTSGKKYLRKYKIKV